ncbi:hypothetical protein B9Z55_003414 [Caenorhabditis nigoni]|uniref:Uncharacterized protein n=1 Tax=Caenorhabditis nigoni TaxID=1611254 RepID=A0A2G5VQN6_9PELO|nr:hypothetical protein B9Z55_003414 [Caenorhabditis nigoni]
MNQFFRICFSKKLKVEKSNQFENFSQKERLKMRGIPTLLLLFGLSTVRAEESIIDRLVANQATNAEQRTVLESVATILSRSPKQHYKYELVKIIGKSLRNPTNIGGNVSEKAIDNIREVFKNSENPKNVLEFLEICMDYLKKSNKNEALKLNFIDRCVEKLEGNLNFEDIKTLIETGHWILPTETSNYLGIQILQAPPPIIDRMIENEADLLEKRLILFELKTIMNFVVKSSSYKWTLYTIIRKNHTYGNPDSVGGPISMQAVRNIQNALQMSENPKAFLEFLDICMDFLRSPATTNPPKLMVLHEAVFIVGKGYGIEEVKKSLMDEPSNILESIFEALGIPERKDTTLSDSSTCPTTVVSESAALTESHTDSPIVTPSLPTARDQFIDKMNNYVREHPILLSDAFLKLFEIPTKNVQRDIWLITEFYSMEILWNKLKENRDVSKPDENTLRMLTEINQLDLDFLIDFFKFSKEMNVSETVDFYKEIWPNENFGIEELNYYYVEGARKRVHQNLREIRDGLFNTIYPKPMMDALIEFVDLYWLMLNHHRQKMVVIMTVSSGKCNDSLYDYMTPILVEKIQKTLRSYDATFKGFSCYHSKFQEIQDPNKIQNYVKEHPILSSDAFLKLFEMDTISLRAYFSLLHACEVESVRRDLFRVGFQSHSSKPDENILRMLLNSKQLDLDFLIDFFKIFKDMNGSQTADDYKKIWSNVNIGNEELDKVIENLEIIKIFAINYTIEKINALIEIVSIYWDLEDFGRERLEELMSTPPEECNDKLYKYWWLGYSKRRVQHKMKLFDRAFGGHSCYHSEYSKSHP